MAKVKVACLGLENKLARARVACLGRGEGSLSRKLMLFAVIYSCCRANELQAY